jgi:glycosyltransferase involved in cell wall biosynthesis
MLAVSAALKRDMVALGMPEDRIRVHYTGVDLDRFQPFDRDAAKAALGIAGPLLITVGYLIERKGQQLVVEAMKKIPEATLLLVGEGPGRPAIEAQIARAGLKDRVRLLGGRPHDDLPGLFAAADLMVLPSMSEGLANVWVEALACGTPIVIADVGGARELLDRPAAGLLAERDPDAIAAAVRTLLAAPPARLETRATAERFTWETNGAALEAHLSGLIQR